MAPSIPVTRLYPTNAKDDAEANFDVIFFHGLKVGEGTDYEKTWTNNENILWPRQWLPKDLKRIRVFSVSYDAEATKWFVRGNTEDVEHILPREDVAYIGENILQNVVIGSDRIGSRPFALVGHSFGGLVIKALINEATTSSGRTERNALDGRAISKAKKFLENLKVVVFYAVPHSEADTQTLTRYVKFCSKPAPREFLENMEPFQRKMAKMSVMMKDAFSNKKINIFAFGEGQPTYHDQMVVEPASAMQLAGNKFYKLQDCNHTEVCKPVNKQHPSYSILVNILRTYTEGTGGV
ncbi:hypothetical protein BDL97_18G003500 [Sphagnum fallax]|nr:hypothetical protein BDL97_18G003500 [Sphagnum fallax]KAH8932893.1 hypothetical protein BDL97_18G003500 [Sphagnum fallax]